MVFKISYFCLLLKAFHPIIHSIFHFISSCKIWNRYNKGQAEILPCVSSYSIFVLLRDGKWAGSSCDYQMVLPFAITTRHPAIRSPAGVRVPQAGSTLTSSRRHRPHEVSLAAAPHTFACRCECTLRQARESGRTLLLWAHMDGRERSEKECTLQWAGLDVRDGPVMSVKRTRGRRGEG